MLTLQRNFGKGSRRWYVFLLMQRAAVSISGGTRPIHSAGAGGVEYAPGPLSRRLALSLIHI